jgi:hypothetical protein
VRIEPPVLPDLSRKRLNSGSAIKNKKLGYEPHSNSMVRIGTFLYGDIHIGGWKFIFLVFLRPLCIISNSQTFWSFEQPNKIIFPVQIEPPVLPDLSRKRLNSGSAIKNKKLGNEPHSNSMVRIGTFLYGDIHIGGWKFIFLVFLRPLCSTGRVESKTPLIIVITLQPEKRPKGRKS